MLIMYKYLKSLNPPIFIVESVDRPFVSREEGGHIRIVVKDQSITDRHKAYLKGGNRIHEAFNDCGRWYKL